MVNKREILKERLLATTTTIVLATVDYTDYSAAPCIKVLKDISKETAARHRIPEDRHIKKIVIDVGYRASESEINEAFMKAKKEAYDAIDDPQFWPTD